MATEELVDEVFEITNNRLKVIKIISLAKSAIRNNLGEELNQIKQPLYSFGEIMILLHHPL